MNKIILYITGKKGSGKTTLLNLFFKEGYFTTEFGNNLEDALSKGKISPKSIPLHFSWTEEMLEFTFEKIREKQLVVLTGLYNTHDLNHLYKLGFQVVIVSILTKDEIRYRRVIKRENKKNNLLKLEDLHYKDSKRDGTAKGFEFNNINDLIASSHYLLENNNSIKEFEINFHKLLLTLRADFPNVF